MRVRLTVKRNDHRKCYFHRRTSNILCIVTDSIRTKLLQHFGIFYLVYFGAIHNYYFHKFQDELYNSLAFYISVLEIIETEKNQNFVQKCALLQEQKRFAPVLSIETKSTNRAHASVHERARRNTCHVTYIEPSLSSCGRYFLLH